MERKTLEVKTPFGMLCAEIGGDPKDYPEIFLYIRRPDGIEIDLCCASADIENEQMNAFLYGDPYREDWTKKHIWNKEDFDINYEEK